LKKEWKKQVEKMTNKEALPATPQVFEGGTGYLNYDSLPLQQNGDKKEEGPRWSRVEKKQIMAHHDRQIHYTSLRKGVRN